MNAEEFTTMRAAVSAGSPSDAAFVPPQAFAAAKPARGARRIGSSRLHISKGASDLERDIELSDAVPLQDFLKDLHREKRRSDRCKAPLSLALYQVCDDPTHMLALLEVVHRITRETDIIGHVGNDTLALLCPDTDAAGIRAVLRRIDANAPGKPFNTVAAATHPDVLFDKIANGELGAGTDDDEPLDGHPRALGVTPAFVSDRLDASRHGYALKRVIDVVGALAGLLVFMPLMLVAALAVRASSRGPVIYCQRRLGQGGRPFVFYKFRSMFVGADERVHRAFVASLIAGEAPRDPDAPAARPYKLSADPRITPIGRLIRRTSIDELPQLFNVLKGDMSLVGPRPPIPYEAARYQAWHLRRLLTAKPGLTGLWQVEGRSRVSFNEMVRMDLRYIRDCSLVMDLRILLKTVKVVLRCEGAA